MTKDNPITAPAAGEQPVASQDPALAAPAATPVSTGPTPGATAPLVLDGGLSIYPVLSPLRHDGKLYSPDDADANLVALDPKDAKALQALGVLGEASTDADVSAATAKPKAKTKK